MVPAAVLWASPLVPACRQTGHYTCTFRSLLIKNLSGKYSRIYGEKAINYSHSESVNAASALIRNCGWQGFLA
jgi:hypothetical protein